MQFHPHTLLAGPPLGIPNAGLRDIMSRLLTRSLQQTGPPASLSSVCLDKLARHEHKSCNQDVYAPEWS